MSIDNILGVSSGGGHLVQLMAIESNTKYYFSHIITTVDSPESDKPEDKFFKVIDCNVYQPLKLFLCFFQLLRIIYQLRPSCIISTGAAPGGLALILGKFFRCKTIWVDSIANTKKASLTGRLVKPFSDVWISQWEPVAIKNKGVYIGQSINIFNRR